MLFMVGMAMPTVDIFRECDRYKRILSYHLPEFAVRQSFGEKEMGDPKTN